jgi:hypothetical protein
MAKLLQVIAQSGPLPIKNIATIETDDPVIVTVSGSVWTATPNTMIGFGLKIDQDTPVPVQIFSNGPNEHRAVVPLTFSHTFPVGDHAFALVPLNSQTTSDANDYYCVTVQY